MAVTLAALHRSLPADLIPCPPGREVPARDISAVHVSELPDPSRYLEGGELLLTTGLSAVPTAAWFSGYLARLQQVGIAGVALGLGPRFADVPPALVAAADSIGLPLFVVPERTPFLTISRRYWEMAAVSGRRHVANALAGHRALVEAATAPNPEAAVIRRLALSVGGWAAHLSRTGALHAVYPASARAHARELRDEIARLAVAGTHAATLPVGDQVVVLHPLTERAAAGQATGFVAVGSADSLLPEQRHLVLAGVAVLGAQLNHRRELRVAQLAARTPMLQLLLAGSPDAARALATIVAPQVLQVPHRPAVVTGADLAAVAADHRCAVAWDDGSVLRLLLSADGAELLHGLPGVTGVIGPPVGWDALHQAYDLLAGRAAAADQLVDMGSADGSLLSHLDPAVTTAWAERTLGPILAYDRAELVPALAAYLRSNGGWEAAARGLGVHRHTLRHRVHRAEELLGVDLTDVDVAAELWLALRSLALA